MPGYERGHSGQEIGEMQQRLADLGFEVGITNEFDEYTEEALRRYQTDWLYADGSGIADEETLAQLDYHHSTRPGVDLPGPNVSEEPSYDAGAGDTAQVSEDGQHWWDGGQWIPFENRTPLVDEQSSELPFGLIDEETQAQLDAINPDYGQTGEGDWNPFANPTPELDSGTYQEVKQEAGQLYDEAAETLGKIISGEEPMPDVRN